MPVKEELLDEAESEMQVTQPQDKPYESKVETNDMLIKAVTAD